MRLRDIMISLLIFSGITIGLMIFYEETANLYVEAYPDIVGTYSTNQTFAVLNRTKEIVDITEDMSNKLTSLTNKTNILTAVADSFVLTFDFFGLLAQTPNIVIGVFRDTTSILTTIGFPGWFLSMMSGIVLVVVIFTIASLFLKGRV